MEFNDIQTFFAVLIAIASAIVTIGGAITFIIKMKEMINKKSKDNMTYLQQTVDAHSKDIYEIRNDMCQLKEDIQENKTMTVLICKGVKCLMDNSITGNGIDNLKKTRKDIDDYLIDRSK